MPRPDRPDDFETIALTTDELETIALDGDVDDNATTGGRRAREVIIPFDYSPDDAITEQVRAPQDCDPPPFEPEPRPMDLPRPAASAPPATVSEPEPFTPMFVPQSQPGPALEPASPGGPSDQSAPSWVVGYLVLCAALTVIGLVVLFLERRLLGSASPF
jgi:hypothetical protein